MSTTKKSKAGCRLWRVNIDGVFYTGRWKNIGGAIAAAYQKHCDVATYSAAAKLAEEEQSARDVNDRTPLPPRDFTDMAIHAECIGPALEAEEVVKARDVTRDINRLRVPVYLSAEQQRALMGAWHSIVGTPPGPIAHPTCVTDGHLFGGAAQCERCGTVNPTPP